jgi:hypothetical protein
MCVKRGFSELDVAQIANQKTNFCSLPFLQLLKALLLNIKHVIWRVERFSPGDFIYQQS